MSREQITALLAEADAQGWKWVGNEAPQIGERVEVMHIASRGYDTTGECDADGTWHCANGFIMPNMTLTFNPTHWRAATLTSEADHG